VILAAHIGSPYPPANREGRVARGINWLWCAGIPYSMIAARQHVTLDVLAGAALGAIVAVPNLRWVRRGEVPSRE
jgi:membrane-associated phospholipid phosphatase